MEAEVELLVRLALDHDIMHVAEAGKSCHGRVDEEEIVKVQVPLSMGWCLECHRDVRQNQGASQYLRPVSQITNMEWQRTGNEPVTPPRHLNPPENCTGCHR